eukprot:Pgem_evm1s4834
MLKYVQALKAINNEHHKRQPKPTSIPQPNNATTTNGRRTPPERNNNGEQQHIRYHRHVVHNTLWMWTTLSHIYNESGTIDKLFHDIQEEFINAEIKIEDKKSLYTPCTHSKDKEAAPGTM